MWLDVNGERVQTGSTRTMIFGVAHLVSYVSHFMTLLPGDVFTTGTRPGVGMGQKPSSYLKAGDVVPMGIEKLGDQRKDVIGEKRGGGGAADITEEQTNELQSESRNRNADT